MTKNKLIEAALDSSTTRRARSTNASNDEIELAIAYFKGDVTASEAARAYKATGLRKMPNNTSTVMFLFTRILREAVTNGKIKIERA